MTATTHLLNLVVKNHPVALTLMIAENKPGEKDIMAQVVVNLINDYN